MNMQQFKTLNGKYKMVVTKSQSSDRNVGESVT